MQTEIEFLNTANDSLNIHTQRSVRENSVFFGVPGVIPDAELNAPITGAHCGVNTWVKHSEEVVNFT